jgi:hypothetical protein
LEKCAQDHRHLLASYAAKMSKTAAMQRLEQIASHFIAWRSPA